MRSCNWVGNFSVSWRDLTCVLVGSLLALTLFLIFGGQEVPSASAAASELKGDLAGKAVNSTILRAETGGSSLVSMSVSANMMASTSVSYTTYLPVIFARFGAPNPLALGVQVNHIGPETTDAAAEARAGWVRMRLNWDSIEPENTIPENYSWSPGLDQELASYAANGVRVILTIMKNPDWAANYPAGPIDKVDIGELAEFMQAVVERYGVPPYNVKHWEMYNEPDNLLASRAADGYGFFGNDPQAYVDMLEAVYQPIKDVDPEAQVIFGGLAYDGWENGFSESFLDDVLAIMQSRGSYPFDTMNFHYYPLFAYKWESLDPGIDIIAKTNYIRRKMAVYGADKPLVCSETSMWSNCIDEDNEVLCGSDEKQSRYVPQVHVRGQAAGLEFSVWFMLYDGSDPGDWGSGLLDANLEPKPSHQAYLTLGEQLLQTHYSRTLDVSETGSDQIEAYEFLQRDGIHRVVVAWSNDDLDYTMRLPGASLAKVGKYGDEAVIYDGDDGQADGYVTVNIGPSPVYLRLDQ